VPTVVKTDQGALRGSVVDGVHRFFGVPYAAPPSGINRLRPPAPPEAWTGERDATRFGPEPPQVAPPVPVTYATDRVTGDDCLNLNIWTPDPGSAGLPVMVWVQGGMFEISSLASYDGRNFARDGVVCVTSNWRVGADGFLCLGDGTDNLGLLDQVAALQWVRDNIAGFGGDPDNVTIFGESAGAMSISTLLAMPRAHGLFRRAITQSGAAHSVLNVDDAERVGRRLAENLGLAPEREAIAAVPIARLLLAQGELKDDLLAHPDPNVWGDEVVASVMPWQPVVDGDVLPGRPIERIAAGAGAEVDLIAGTNEDEWRLFRVLSGDIDAITDEILTGSVADQGYQSLAAYGLSPNEALAAYRSRSPDASPGDLLASVQTDWWMRVPAIRLADAHAGRGSASTFMYEFAWPSPVFDGRLGAVHALEVPFVFDTLDPDLPLLGMLLGPEPPQALADAMHSRWVSFARNGDPGWTRYDLAQRATMRFDTVSHVVDDPRPWERALWDGRR
jgi:para-nitrobenzyl esterase